MGALAKDFAGTLGIAAVTEVAADTAVISAIMASRGKASWRFVVGAGAVAAVGIFALLRAVPYIEQKVLALAVKQLEEADGCCCCEDGCCCEDEACGCEEESAAGEGESCCCCESHA